MPRQTQFGVRKNPAPHSRQHGLCLAADTNSENEPIDDVLQTRAHLATNSPATEPQLPPHAAPIHAATAEEEQDSNYLLTVCEVAELLQVPVSWVYERTRKRGTAQLPHLKIGKYLRFEQPALAEFIRRQRCA